MSSTQPPQLAPAELAYLRSSLSQKPKPIRPDGRSATQFRPLAAESGILPGTNGSARVCFDDGSEAVVGVKAEVERTALGGVMVKTDGERPKGKGVAAEGGDGEGEEQEDDGEDEWRRGSPDWVEMTVEIPGTRDDDAGTAFLAGMLAEALLADGAVASRLVINRRFHWRLYLDILLISTPLSYPLPLLSLTTHLGLLATRLPRLKSEGEEDPMFDDDWDSSPYLFPRLDGSGAAAPPGATTTAATTASNATVPRRPPVTLLVMSVAGNIIFDPSREELAVADAALAVSFGDDGDEDDDDAEMRDPSSTAAAAAAAASRAKSASRRTTSQPQRRRRRRLRLVGIRTIDPPSRLTAPGVPDALNPATWAAPPADNNANSYNALKSATTTAEDQEAAAERALAAALAEEREQRDGAADDGVWRAPRGGARPALLMQMVAATLQPGGVAHEVLDALEAVEVD